VVGVGLGDDRGEGTDGSAVVEDSISSFSNEDLMSWPPVFNDQTAFMKERFEKLQNKKWIQ